MKPRDLSKEECSSILSAARYGRLGLAREGRPYVVPMSYVYADGRIYLHS
nr:pyridoxamine 5'-phosphate oxidase family protein [Methanothrix sp.]